MSISRHDDKSAKPPGGNPPDDEFNTPDDSEADGQSLDVQKNLLLTLEPDEDAEPAGPVLLIPRTSDADMAERDYESAALAERRRQRESRRKTQRYQLTPEQAKSAGLSRRQTSLSLPQVRQLLDNPTKTITEADLKRDYSYVLTDLRSMGLLAAGLVVVLIILAQVV